MSSLTRVILTLSMVSAYAKVAAASTEVPVSCDLPGVFAPAASWQAISSGHAGCEGAQWVGDTLYYS
ncbi:MAG: hypothetical protein RI910_2724, partial [Verrucomicrobiota bacterium]